MDPKHIRCVRKITMEAVGSTFRKLFGTEFPPESRAGEVRKNPSQIAETVGGNVKSSGSASVTGLQQQGVQPSERRFAEFSPYSPTDKLKKPEADAAQKAPGNRSATGGASVAGGTTETQDPQVQAQIQQLKAIEEKVKAHEAAHKSAGGAMTGPVSYSFTRGPDGKNYITGGEVPISVSPGKTPRETITRMQQVIQAALAPADPSAQDRSVAAQAAAQQQQASQQLAAASAQTTQGTPAAAPDPGQQADSLAARDSRRAYGNPAVTGKQPEVAVSVGPAQQEQRGSAPSLTGVISGALATMTSASITGFASSQPLSYYA
jgi:hypothetical protein